MADIMYSSGFPLDMGYPTSNFRLRSKDQVDLTLGKRSSRVKGFKGSLGDGLSGLEIGDEITHVNELRFMSWYPGLEWGSVGSVSPGLVSANCRGKRTCMKMLEYHPVSKHANLKWTICG